MQLVIARNPNLRLDAGIISFYARIMPITEVNNEVTMLADDAKLFRMVTSKVACKELQNDISKLDEWVRKWQTTIIVCVKRCITGQKPQTHKH